MDEIGRALLAEIRKDVRDIAPKLQYADYWRERGYPTLADVWEWIGKTGRFPYADYADVEWQWAWFDDGKIHGPQHCLPGCLWRAMWEFHEPKQPGTISCFAFRSADLAIAALAPAWKSATRSSWFNKGWTPDYKVVDWISADQLDMYRALQGVK